MLPTALIVAGGIPTVASSQPAVQGVVDSQPSLGISIDDIELKLFKLSQTLLQDPENPVLLLQKGVLLSKLGKNLAAFDIFESLRMAFPDNPTPYANLASLYARAGRLEDARQMLMKADSLQENRAQTQLSLATVNLGLAMNALTKASEIDPSDLATKQKLKALLKYVTESDKSVVVTSTEVKSKSTNSPVNPSFTSPGQSEKNVATRIANTQLMPRDRLMLSTAVELEPAMMTAVPKNTSPNKPPHESTDGQAGSEEEQKVGVRKALEAWGTAWTQRAYEDYAAAYSTEFQPADGMTRDAWVNRKKAILGKAQFIKVEIKVTRIQIAGAMATVKLSQQYRSDRYAETGDKELKLVKEDANWKILSEKPLK